MEGSSIYGDSHMTNVLLLKNETIPSPHTFLILLFGFLILPLLFTSRTCTMREAVILGSIIECFSIPPQLSSAALSKLAMMDYYCSTRVMPVIWHQSLLAFAQRYKNELTKEDKDNLYTLLEKQKHKLVTPEILRELNNSRNRGEKESISRLLQQRQFDIPEVPVEED